MDFPHLTLLLLITGSTRAPVHANVLLARPQNHFQTGLYTWQLSSLTFFLSAGFLFTLTQSNTTKLLCFNLFYFSSLHSLAFFSSFRSITITIFFSFYHFSFFVTELCCFSFLFYSSLIAASFLWNTFSHELDRTNTFTDRYLLIQKRESVCFTIMCAGFLLQYPSTRFIFFGFRFLSCIFYF